MAQINEAIQNFRTMIVEELGFTPEGQKLPTINEKLNWLAQYAANHDAFNRVMEKRGFFKKAEQSFLNEGIQNPAMGVDAGIYQTPLNTLGAGNPMFPGGVGFNPTDGAGIGNTGSDFHAYNYQRGSGDIPGTMLSMSLEVAAMTIGLELVPVIPTNVPWVMLQYFEVDYAGGKMGALNETSLDGKGDGAQNKPIYIYVLASMNDLMATYAAFDANNITVGSKLKFVNASVGQVHGTYMGKSRINGKLIIKVEHCADTASQPSGNISIAQVLNGRDDITIDGLAGVTLKGAMADTVSSAADHIQGFANFFDGSDDPMTRAQNETGVGNVMGPRLTSKVVQVGSYEVTGAVTRQQLQDYPLYGIDVVGKVLEWMQNQISQNINNRILDRVFKLGVTNAVNQKAYQGVDLNLYIAGAGSPDTKDLKDFKSASKFVGIDNVNYALNWGPIKNATKNTAAETVTTHQRRIMTRIQAAKNLTAVESRFGYGHWVVINHRLLSALQDCSGFVVAPMINTLTQDTSGSVYFAGSIGGLNVYVDPNMKWDDLRVCVGRKSDGRTPGVVFAPYILMDSVNIIAEGTMAPKVLVNSRFAIIDNGFHPEMSYFTFIVDDNDDVMFL